MGQWHMHTPTTHTVSHSRSGTGYRMWVRIALAASCLCGALALGAFPSPCLCCSLLLCAAVCVRAGPALAFFCWRYVIRKRCEHLCVCVPPRTRPCPLCCSHAHFTVCVCVCAPPEVAVDAGGAAMLTHTIVPAPLTSPADTITLNDGTKIPVIGLGVWDHVRGCCILWRLCACVWGSNVACVCDCVLRV